MARPRAARRRHRGGESISSTSDPRPSLTRPLAGAGALAAAAGLAAVAIAQSGTDAGRAAAAVLAGLSIVVLAAAIRFGFAGLVVWGVALLGASYAASLAGRGLDLGAAGVGAGLLMVAELASWAIEARRTASVEPAVARIRANALAGAGLGAAAAGTLVMGATVSSARGGYGFEVLGALAAAGVVLVAALAFRARR